ncbi:hypothetical protein PPERSA_05222 [Pseudocohnilembus persalinus]|uniref:Translation initiation factor eIF2B subunit delta n=1 Tax=Pseudocohnilembus persalinus TaxID=266149 RepID=A0A0V0R9E7_PSEPJ|nr:hypothetical protein PPERSA_05222 [Pseudocohnilembus persalinus]|eukprot:KRX11113.1 hypothetical protein PPERSA_05222 [Pseudocohnilembus persalinus]
MENQIDKKKKNYTPEQEQLYQNYLKQKSQELQNQIDNLTNKQEQNSISSDEKKALEKLKKEQQQQIKAQEKKAQFEQEIQKLEALGEDRSKEEEVEYKKILKKKKNEDTKEENDKYRIITELVKKQAQNQDNQEQQKGQVNEEKSKQSVGQMENKEQKPDKHKKQYTQEQEELYNQYIESLVKNQNELIADLEEKQKVGKINEQEKKTLDKEQKAKIQREKAQEKLKKQEDEIKQLEDLGSDRSKEQDVEYKKLSKKIGAEKTKLENDKFRIINQLIKGEISLNQEQSQKQETQPNIKKQNKQQDDIKQKESSKQQQQKQQQQQNKQVTFKGEQKSILKKENNNNKNQKKNKATSNGSLMPEHLQSQYLKSTSQIKQSKQNPQSDIHKNTHPALIELGVKFSNDIIIGSNKRCEEYLKTICIIVQSINTENKDDFIQQLGDLLNETQEQLQTFRSISEGMNTAYNFCKNLQNLLKTGSRELANELTVQNLKDWFCNYVQSFIDIKITKADRQIIELGQHLVKDGDVIMVYARSQIVENLLIKCHQNGQNFQIIVVDNSPYNEGKQLLKNLTNAGIECMYTMLSNSSYFIKKVNKIFVGASTMLSNGSLVSRVGTALLSCIANDYRKPFHVFCESYKFSEKTYLDSLNWNEFSDNIQNSNQNNSKISNNNIQNQPENKQKSPFQNISYLNLRYDITSSENINMLVTEYGKVPSHSVPHIIREFSKYGQIGRIDLPIPQK